jgi:cellular nucleic acid-binding protein
MNDKQGTRGSKHRTKHVSRPPTPPKHTTTPINRGKRRSERKRKAEEPAEVLKQLQAEEAEAQTALNAALVVAEEAAKRTTTAEDASNGPGAREGDGDPSPDSDASEAEWVKALKDAETAAKALATNRAAALEADQAEKAHCRHVKGLPCDNPRCNNFFVCLRQQQLRAYVMRHPTKPKPEAEEKEETLCYNCSKPGHQSYECPDNNDNFHWQTAATDQEWSQDKNWTADTGEQKTNELVCYHCNQTDRKAWQRPEKCYNCGRPGHIRRNRPDKGGKGGKGVQEPQNYTATTPPLYAGQSTPPTEPPPAHAAPQDAYKAGSIPWPCERCKDGTAHSLSACPSYKGCENCSSKLHLQRKCLRAPKNKGGKGGKGGNGGKDEPRNYAATPPPLYAPGQPGPPTDPPPAHAAIQDAYKAGSVPWPCNRCNDGTSHRLPACPSYTGCELCSSKHHLQRKCPLAQPIKN